MLTFRALPGVPRRVQMTVTIGRRKFIAGLGGAALAWPLAASAQQPAVPVIGFLNSTSPDPSLGRVAAFRRGLNEVGYVERQSVAIEYRWAENKVYKLQRLVAALVRRQVAVISTTVGTAAALSVKRSTSTIPVFFYIFNDPVTS